MPRINFKKLQSERPEPTEEGASKGFPREEIVGPQEPQEPNGSENVSPSGEFIPDFGGAAPATSRAPVDSGWKQNAQRQHRTGQMRSTDELVDEHIRTLGTDEALQATIRAAMDGSLPLDRALKGSEPRKLNPSSVQVVILRMLGYRRKEVAALTGYTEAGVGLVLRHPYAQRIMAHGISGSIQSLSDVRGRLQRRAPDMLDVAEDIAEDPDAKPETRLKAAFGLLDRAGYGAVQKQEVDQKVSGRVEISNDRAELLTAAIREAHGEATDADYYRPGTEEAASESAPQEADSSPSSEGGQEVKALPAVDQPSEQDADSSLNGSDPGGPDLQDH